MAVLNLHKFFFPAEQSLKESLPVFCYICGLLIFFGFMGFSKALFNIGAILICLGLISQLCLLGAKSFLLAHSKPLLILLFFAFGWLAFCSFSGLDVHAGSTTFRTAIYKGLALFIVGMQLTLYPRYIRIFLAVLFLAAFVQGLDGIWQYYTGYDFIRDTPVLGSRLTGAFSTYRVGDLMSMCLVLFFCLPWLLPKSWGLWLKGGAATILLAPPVFLCIFADSRSGFNFIFAVFVSLMFLRYGIRLKIILPVLLLVVLAVNFGISRYSLEVMMQDGRIKEVWPFAWEVFKANPITGAGSSSFTAAFTKLGLTPLVESDDLNHPHNIYLQFLAEQGVIGLILWLSFFGSIILVGWKTLRARASVDFKRLGAQFAAICWAGCCGYMLMAFTAHSFLRDWWLGFAMFYFGVTAGFSVLLIIHFLFKRILLEQNMPESSGAGNEMS